MTPVTNGRKSGFVSRWRKAWEPLQVSSLIVFLLLSAGVILLWYLATTGLRQRQIDNAYATLSAIADFKVQELVEWRRRHLEYGGILMANPAIVDWVASLSANPQDEMRRREVARWLDDVVVRQKFLSAVLVDSRIDRVLANSARGASPREHAARGLAKAIHDRETQLSDLHVVPDLAEAHLDLYVPLFKEDAVVGAFLFRINPRLSLYPMLKSWPLYKSTGESVLLRREGQHAVYLNRLRYVRNEPLTLRVDLDTPNMPEALAVLGMEGPMEGQDYSGDRVLAVMRPVPGTAWCIVTKMRKSEPLEALHSEQRLLTLTGAALINLALFALGFAWYRQKRDLALVQERTEAGRRALAQHYVHLAQYANDIILLADPDWKIIETNERALRSYGCSKEAILGMTLDQFWPLELREESRRLFRKLRQQHVLTFETTHCRADGRKFPVEVSLRFVHESGLQYTQAVIQDITERIQKRLLLERYQALCRHARDIILFVGCDGAILEANDAAAQAYGYSREELLRMNIREVRAMSHRAELAGQLEVAGRQAILFETVHRARSGVEFPVEVSATPVILGEERLILSIIRDVSTRKGVESALKVSEQNLRQVMDIVPQAIYARDSEGRIILVNRRFAELSGKTPDELIAGAFSAPAELAQATDAEVLRARSPVIIPEETWQEPDGTLHVMQTTKTMFLPAGNGKPAVLSVSADITESKHLQEQLLHAQKMESVGRLAGGVAHEFNNLLQAMMGFSEILLGRMRENDPNRADVVEIDKAAKRAGTLTAQLLAYSRKQVMDPRVRNINEIVQGVTGFLNHLLEQSVRLALTLDPRIRSVRVDAGQIEQVLMNLVVNARDAMPSGGTVSISTREAQFVEEDILHIPGAHAGAFVCLSVGDTGVGMDSETRAHMFEPFFTTKAMGKGTGLGLAMVYGIVKQHGGWIDVFSEVGLGSVFRIYLPVAEAEEAQGLLRRETLRIPAEFRGIRILVVEDDDAVRQFAARALKDRGFRVFACDNREEALAVYTRHGMAFDMVFADIVLPDGNGLELARSLCGRSAGMHVLLTSGYLDVHDRWPEIQARPWPFLQKPYSADGLVDAVVESLKTVVKEEGAGG